ncbi:TetR family transcriptional regulator [Streptomyces sp. H28]|uniref:TetR/AcrR family transcriptional regulator n=1 Tax=Streptomyces sp. H28 TaxID=2775865 RepID=UPI00178115F6|nr:TetR family transcriptional regulator [Streptomyces sp. H28]MBD9730682.1 TetR family transcriptional regulator [Streptomyces sp. H28]
MTAGNPSVEDTTAWAAEPMSRDKVVHAALSVIDRDGLGALNMRRLATELDVTGGLLYHYVDNKADILQSVAALVLGEVKVPQDSGSWRQWAIELTTSFREAFVRHPNVLPLMMDGLPRRLSTRLYSRTAQVLVDGGVPRERVSTLMEGLEAIAIGHAVYSSAALRGSAPDFGERQQKFSPLHDALSAVDMTADQRFQACITALLDGFVPPERGSERKEGT